MALSKADNGIFVNLASIILPYSTEENLLK
jgi:hypothetical protein